MRKTKLLMATFALICAGLSSQAFAYDAPVPKTTTFTASENTDTYYYLYNVDAGLFFTEGNAWGTQMSLGEKGLKVAFTADATYPSSYLFNDFSVAKNAWKLVFFDTKTQLFVDRGSQPRYRWGVSVNGATFRLYAANADNGNPDWGESDPAYVADMYVGWDKTSGSTACTPYLPEDPNNCINWALVTEDDYNLYLAKGNLYNALVASDNHYTNSTDNSAGTAKAAFKAVLDDAKAVYDNASATLADINNEVNKVNAAKLEFFTSGAAPTAGHPFDMTFLVVNPDFSTGKTDGWTKDTPFGGNCAIQGGSRMEYWAGNASDRAQASFNIYQELTNLPDGVYTISADMYNSLNGEGGDYTVFSPTCGLYGSSFDEQHVLVNVEGDVLNPYTTPEITVYGGKLTIGVKNFVTPMAARWFLFDNVKLSFVRAFDAAEYLAIAKAAYQAEMDKAKAVASGTIPTAAYNALQTNINNNTLADGTLEQYNAATEALKDATETATAMAAPYEAYKANKVVMSGIINQTDAYTDPGTATSNYNDAVAAADLAVENATEKEGVEAQITAVTNATKTFIGAVEMIEGKFFDLTALIVNPHFTEGTTDKPTGWTIESGSLTELRLVSHNYETYHKKFNLSQTIAAMPKGTYKVTLQGFARHDGSDKDKTNLYCGIVDQPIKNIKDEYSTTPFYVDGGANAPLNWEKNYDASYTLNGETVYQPNGMNGSYYWFRQENPLTGQPFYTNEVQTLVLNDGDLKIGFKCETETDWVIWDNFHLYYYGSDINITLDEASGSAFSEEFTATNLTLKKKVVEGYNTIILPFEVTRDQLGTNKVYVYEGDADGVLKFKSTRKLLANTPYLIKFDGESTVPFEFQNVNIVKAAESLATEGTEYDFVGTFGVTTAIEAGDYVLGNGEFVKAKGGNKVKAFRAYIKKKAGEAEARALQISIDGVTTAIDAIDGESTVSGAIYNLAGQQVKKAQKGLYIQNGKKMLVK